MQILILCPAPFQKPEKGEGAETGESLAARPTPSLGLSVAARPTPSLGLSVLICKMGALRSPPALSLRCPRECLWMKAWECCPLDGEMGEGGGGGGSGAGEGRLQMTSESAVRASAV